MKKAEELPKYVQNVIKKEPLVRSSEIGFNAKFSKNLKKFLYVSGFIGMGFFFNSCIAGYVDTEPTYVEGIRPAAPSYTSIWIDGDWVYNRQNRVYARQEGHWGRPVQGKVYVAGRWEVSSKGRHWTPGRWQRQK
jgi:hypothetical protein